MLFREIKKLNTVQVDSGLKDISFYTETLEMTIRLNEDWYNVRKKMMNLEHYAIVNEDSGLLNEGSKDFFHKIKEFFVRIWDEFRNLWHKFNVFMSKTFLSDEKFIKKYRDQLQKINLEDYSYNGFIYTIPIDIPKVNPDMDFLVNDKYLGNNFANVTSLDILEVKTNYKDMVHDSHHYDLIRGKLIDRGRVSEDDFQEELFKVFRNNENSTGEIAVNSSVLDVMIKSVEEHKNDIKKCEEIKRKIDKFYQNVITYFDKMIDIEYTTSNHHQGNIHIRGFQSNPNDYTFKANKVKDSAARTIEFSDKNNNELVEALHDIAKLKSEEARRISFIYNQAFASKLDAIKDRRKDYREVLIDLLSNKQN